MSRITILIVVCVTVAAHGDLPTNGLGNAFCKPDDLLRRTGIFLPDIPAAIPEDKLYRVEDNLFKLDDYYRLYGTRLEVGDLSRFERAFRLWGICNGVFNVPDGISRGDEWDTKTYTVAKRSEKGELVPLSKAEITRGRIGARPYMRGEGSRYIATLGQLTKQCDGIFVGKITEVKGIDETDKDSLKRGLARVDRPADITFLITTNLFGRLPSDTVTIPILWMEGKEQLPERGVKALVFYAKGYSIGVLDFSVNGFDWEKPPEKPDVSPSMLFKKESTSIRLLKTSELETTYIETVDGYLQLLRREERDPDKYYGFLRSLVKSPVWLIRQDAREDMLKLLGHRCPDRFDLERIPDDPELDWDLIKDYVRYVAVPDRENRKAEQKTTK